MKRRNYSTNSVPLYGGSIHSTNFWGSRIQRGECKVGGEKYPKCLGEGDNREGKEISIARDKGKEMRGELSAR
jgi:hypothetical protein